ncbi:hypothetical protein [Sphingomonas alpina]|uniref:Uncharacterized protein n=1 Tax=Sphingomonas alpina TaxID=653931 RepID=A0A7H0LHV6_9SPHN|nr:hypothetical protein [Sphingomonas alpina]QNQ09259.1 hypothetical protein H3Z74_21735 [Sphingomonas alpina]
MTTEASSLFQAMEAEVGTVMGVDAGTEQLDLLRDPETGKLPSNVFQLARSRAEGRGVGRPAGARNKKSAQLARLIVEKHGDPVLGMAAIYAMPLDQLVELLLIADGSKERMERFEILADRVQTMVDHMLDGESGRPLTDKQVEKLGELAERMGDLAKTLKSKPGELALKALNTQLQARREVAQYVHGKMPVAIDVNSRADVILNIPGLTDPAHLAEYVEHGELTDVDINRLEFKPFEDAARDDDDGADNDDG